MEPLCTWGFYVPALFVQRLSAPDETKILYFQHLLHMLPEPNVTILKKLLRLLIKLEVWHLGGRSMRENHP